MRITGKVLLQKKEQAKEKMRRGCKKCSEWEKHFYWSHLDQKKICFCKKMDASSFMEEMDIPNDFRRNFKGRIGESVELKVPSGNVWQVGVIKSAGKFTFQSGWKDFVIANNIEANDLLIFKYSGNSSFQVQIFDPTSGSEKAYLFFPRIEKIKVQNSSESDSSIKVFEGPGRHVDLITISGSSSDAEYSRNHDKTTVKMSRWPASKEAGTSKKPNGRGKFRAVGIEQIIFSHKWFLTPVQKKKILQLSEAIQPGNHCFAILMKYGIMKNRCRFDIPNKFASKHLPQQAESAVVHYKGQTWFLSIACKKQYRQVSAGWREFVKDNNLRVGDLCLFELMMKNEIRVSFSVHISRN